MIVVAGTWEIGWNSPIKEVELWKYPLRDFGVDHLAMYPVSGIKDRFLREFDSLESLVSNYDLPVIIVDEKGSCNLSNFKHPKSALYLFGKASYSPLASLPEAESIVIPTNQNRGLLWPHQAASIVLYDRHLKWQSQ